jgi:hypothetical protein
MTKGIDDSKAVVVFVTKRYCDKVNLTKDRVSAVLFPVLVY